jgi:hypothetical protein
MTRLLPILALLSCAPLPPVLLPLNPVAQERASWCAYAAIAEASGQRQCEIASRAEGADCCAQGDGCILGVARWELIDLVGHLGIEYLYDREPTELDTLQAYLDMGSPVIVLLEPRHEPGHAVVVVGYDRDRLTIDDPQRGRYTADYDALIRRGWVASIVVILRGHP